MSNDSIPTRSANKASTLKEPVKGGVSLAGVYRVREGYTVAYGLREGDVDKAVVGEHKIAKAGEMVELTHEEALSAIKTTINAKKPDGKPHGPAIETEEQYQSRIKAEEAHKEFLRNITEASGNPLLTGNGEPQ